MTAARVALDHESAVVWIVALDQESASRPAMCGPAARRCCLMHAADSCTSAASLLLTWVRVCPSCERTSEPVRQSLWGLPVQLCWQCAGEL